MSKQHQINTVKLEAFEQIRKLWSEDDDHETMSSKMDEIKKILTAADAKIAHINYVSEGVPLSAYKDQNPEKGTWDEYHDYKKLCQAYVFGHVKKYEGDWEGLYQTMLTMERSQYERFCNTHHIQSLPIDMDWRRNWEDLKDQIWPTVRTDKDDVLIKPRPWWKFWL